MQFLGSHEGKPVLGQRLGGFVGGLILIGEIHVEPVPVPGVDDFLFVTEVIQDVGGNLQGLVYLDLRIAAFMLGGDIGDMVGQLHQFIPPVVGLDDDMAR